MQELVSNKLEVSAENFEINISFVCLFRTTGQLRQKILPPFTIMYNDISTASQMEPLHATLCVLQHLLRPCATGVELHISVIQVQQRVAVTSDGSLMTLSTLPSIRVNRPDHERILYPITVAMIKMVILLCLEDSVLQQTYASSGKYGIKPHHKTAFFTKLGNHISFFFLCLSKPHLLS